MKDYQNTRKTAGWKGEQRHPGRLIAGLKRGYCTAIFSQPRSKGLGVVQGHRVFSEVRLVNGSTGDPVLFIDYPGRNNALCFDAGENYTLDAKRLGDLEAVFLSHHHVDHFIGFDRIVRANLDQDKTLHVFGPVGTIGKVYDRIKSYEYQYFPFQKIRIRVTEILDDELKTGLLECTAKFPEPTIETIPWSRPVVYENAELKVEATHVEHTVPCLAYALVERRGYHPDRDKLQRCALKPGPWIAATLDLLRGGADKQDEIEIQGGKYRLDRIAKECFSYSTGGRVAFVTDTEMNDEVRPRLLALAKRATRLYCDSFYSAREAKQAAKHRHMTAVQAAELARDAEVEELVLIHFAGRYAGRYEMLLDEARAVFPRVSAEIPSSPSSEPR